VKGGGGPTTKGPTPLFKENGEKTNKNWGKKKKKRVKGGELVREKKKKKKSKKPTEN